MNTDRTREPLPPLLLAAALASIFAVALTWMLKGTLTSGVERYPDFVPGLVAAARYFKSGEIRAVLFLALAALAAFVPLGWWFSKSARLSRLADRLISPLGTVPEWWGAWFTGIGVYGAFLITAGPDSAASPVMMIGIPMIVAVLCSSGIPLERTVAGLVLAPVFGCAAVLALIASGLIPQEFLNRDILYSTLAFSFVLGLLFATSAPRLLSFFVIALQFPIPFLLLRFVSTTFSNGAVVVRVGMDEGPARWCAVALLAAASIGGCYAIRNRRSAPYPILPLTAAAIAAICGFGVPNPNALSGDDFHLGELALPWQQLHSLGLEPFHEFVSIQGTLGLTYGWVNETFFSGTLATFGHALAFVAGSMAVITSLIMFRTLGARWALLLAPVALPFLDRFWFVAPAFLIVSDRSLIRNPAVWLATASVCVWQAILWNPASGVAFALGISPFGLFQLFRLSRYPVRGWPIRVAGAAAGLTVLAGAFFAVSPLAGVIGFVLEQGGSSIVAHASKWFEPLQPGSPLYAIFGNPWNNRVIFELIRVGGWIVSAIALAVFLGYSALSRRDSPPLPAILISSAGIIFLLAMLPQSFGRIDPPPHLSRTGTLSMFGLSLLVPAAFAFTFRHGRVRPLPAILVGLLCGFPFAFRDLSMNSWTSRLAMEIPVHPPLIRVDGAAEGFPNLGNALVTQYRVDELRRFAQTVRPFLKPGETYLDLSNRSLYHLMLGLPFPVPYPYMLAVNGAIQKRTIAALEAKPPPFAWLLPNIEFDGGTVSLRAYRIYRWLTERHYEYAECAGFTFMIRPDRMRELETRHVPELRSVSLEQAALATTRRALQGIPASWGESWDSLRREVTEAPAPVAVPSAPSVSEGRNLVIDMTFTEALAGTSADYLLLEVARAGKRRKNVALRFQWRDEGEEFSERKEFTFEGAADRYIIPVGSDPRWLLGRPVGFRLLVTGDGQQSKWRITKVSSLTLR